MLIAKTDISLPPGLVIQLKVLHTGEQPLLQIIDHKNLSSNKNIESNLAAFRQAITRQAPLSELF